MRAFRSRTAVRIACLAAFLAAAAATARAEEAQQLQLEVLINGEPKHLIGAFQLQPDGRMAATRQELGEIGLNLHDSTGPPDRLVALEDIPGVGYRYDPETQRIEIEADAGAMGVQHFDAQAEKDETGTPRAEVGGVLNYGVFASSHLDLDADRALSDPGGSVSLDGRVFSGLGVLAQSGLVLATPDSTELVRLDTTFERADPERMVTYRGGDLVSGGLSWTRPIRLGGVQAQRRFALRPDLITKPLPRFSGTAAVPSTVDVYVDGLRLYSQDVGAGPFEISDLPLVSGSGEANVVVKDAAGRESVTSLPFFSSSELLRPGLSDFSAEAGVARRSFGSDSFDYGDTPIGSATLRMGITDWLTVEGHAEGGAGLLNGGGGVAARIGTLGIASVALAASAHDGDSGLLAAGSLQTKLLGIHVGANLRQTFGDYDDLASVTALRGTVGLDLADTRYRIARRLASLTLGTPLPGKWGSVGLNFVHLENAESGTSNILAGSYSRELPREAYFNASAFHDFSGDKGTGLFVGLSMPLGGGVTGSSSGGSGDRGERVSLSAGKALAREPGGVGWHVRADKDESFSALEASASYRSRFARQEIGLRQGTGGTQAAAQLDGAIAVLGGDVNFTNRIDDSFAIVDAGAPGVEVLHENKVVGVTNSSGRLLVPGLRSYEPNLIVIDPGNLPVDVEVAGTEETVIPSDRAGVTVKLAVDTDPRAALITLVSPAGASIEAGSEGQIEGGEQFVVGYDGQAYVKGLRPRNVALIRSESGECRAEFAYAPKAGEQTAIGPVVCH